MSDWTDLPAYPQNDQHLHLVLDDAVLLAATAALGMPDAVAVAETVVLPAVVVAVYSFAAAVVVVDPFAAGGAVVDRFAAAVDNFVVVVR